MAARNPLAIIKDFFGSPDRPVTVAEMKALVVGTTIEERLAIASAIIAQTGEQIA